MSETITIEPDFLTAKQLARKINMSVKFIRHHVQTRRLPGLKWMGRMVRFERRAVEKALLRAEFLEPEAGR